jgi:hypothetical protein
MGFVLLISGWALVVAALILLPGAGQRLAFIVVALAVELLGLFLLASGYKSLQSAQKKSGAVR